VLLKGWNLGLFVNFGQFPCQINADQDRDPQHLFYITFTVGLLLSPKTLKHSQESAIYECVQSI